MGYDGHPTSCLCPSCGHHREIRRVANRRMRARRRRGEPAYGDYNAVLTHLRELVDAGCARRWIADVAHVRPETVSDLLLGRRRRVRADTATALLAVRPQRATRAAARDDHALIPAIGTTRRLRALAAIGHPLYRIADRTGVARTHLRSLARGAQALVTTAIARKIAVAYDRLWNVEGDSVHTRSRAKTLGWMPPLAWDDDTIDHPDAKPHRHERRRKKRAAGVLAEEAAELARQGYTRAQAAERLGVTADAVTAAWLRSGLMPKEAQHDVA